jgi:hypothetical protein
VQAGGAADSGNRSGRDDRAAASLAHLGNRVLDSEEHRAQQNRKSAVPVFGTGLLERADCAAETRVVIDDIEASEFLDRARDRAFDVPFAGNVGELEDRAAAVLLAIADRGLTALAIHIRDHDRGALARESDRGGPSDSTRRAGDYRYLLFKFTHD